MQVMRSWHDIELETPTTTRGRGGVRAARRAGCERQGPKQGAHCNRESGAREMFHSVSP